MTHGQSTTCGDLYAGGRRGGERINITPGFPWLCRCVENGNRVMPAADERRIAVLDDYAKCLSGKKSATPKHQPHLVQQVRESLLFFLADLGRRAAANHGRSNRRPTPCRDNCSQRSWSGSDDWR